MASAKILSMKQNVVQEIENKVKNASTIVLFDYRGLTDNQTKQLRKVLKDNQSDYKVYKNTLLKIALNDLKITDLDAYLEGPTAIAFSNDQISPIKVLNDFAKSNEALVLKAGIVEGKISDQDKLKELAKIPSREGLYTMLAGGMIAIVKDLSIALNLYSEQKES